MRIILILLTVGLLSCNEQKLLEKHESRTGDYILQVVLDNNKPNDEHLGLRLLNKKGDELDYLRTLSGNHMKWAVTWYNDTTIVLDSNDVGTYGWAVDKSGHLKPMDKVSKYMKDKSIEAFRTKYGTHRVQH